MMSHPTAVAVAAQAEVLRGPTGDEPALVRFTITADEPVLAGHYAGFPIFPGVCLVECVHQAVLAVGGVPRQPDQQGQHGQPAAIESTRFLSPVFPGDEVTVELQSRQGKRGLLCAGTVRSPRGEAARVRLRYADGTKDETR
jgi:3-hydroxyacyl-[acyl-carrier-protein] dehydratase